MGVLDLLDAAWYRAVTLSERVAAARALGVPLSTVEVHTDAAARRLQHWRLQPPFSNVSMFAQWLATEGISEEELIRLLGEPPESMQGRFTDIPAWLEKLCRAFDGRSPSSGAPALQSSDMQPTEGFLNLIEPLLSEAKARLRERVQKLIERNPGAPLTPANLETIFLSDLPLQLLRMLSRTLVLELNVVRLEGRLDGSTPEERFQSFVERLRQPEIRLSILREYPVLARQVANYIDQWVAFFLEFLGRLSADWDTIRETFPHGDPGSLQCLYIEAGDRHRNGRSVVICEFSAGFRLVYKPRSMATDIHFQDLAEWFNQRGIVPPLRTLQILDRGTHGWVEFVAAGSCNSASEVSRFYQRQGTYLMLLHLLAATDFHCENLIASGEHPVPVDLEAIFQPIPPKPPAGEDDGVASFVLESVMRAGLLPQRVDATTESAGVDFAGLGGSEGQITPYRIPKWEKEGSDEMRLVRKPGISSAAQNRPSLNGTDVSACDYAKEINEGFARAYRLVLKHRDELLSSTGPLSWFAEDDVRVILRSTRTYHVLREESFHPDVLRDALERDLLLDRLWVAAEALPHLIKVIPAEREDLLNCDIPIFTARPSTRDLWTSSGQQLSNFFEEPAMAFACRRLENFSERDLERQLWIIRASLATSSEFKEDATRPAAKLPELTAEVGREQLLAAAGRVGDILASIAVHTDHDTSWLGLAARGEQCWSISPLTLDLYDGLPGVVLFLAYLADITGEAHYTILAAQACETMLRQLDKDKSFFKSIGAFSGLGGMIYTLSHLGSLWRKPELLGTAERIVAALPPLIEKDEHLDIIGGAAGCIGGLLSLNDQFPSKRTLDIATQCGQHLIARAQQMQHGVGWLIPKERKPLAGFAHGAAGIVWALLKLAVVSGVEHFRVTALDGIAYERSLFSPEAGNWHDVRVQSKNSASSNGDSPSFMTAWCNGAPGIGLARLSTLEQLDDIATRHEIDTALNTTLKHGFGLNHCLCHGDLGNIEAFLQAGQTFNDSRWDAEVRSVANVIVESIAENKVLCATPMSVATPGLMTGLAGIGYGLLRLAEHQRVPSLLTLEPPLRNGGHSHETVGDRFAIRCAIGELL